MDDTLSRFIADLLGRVHGPFTFRFILQPVMAIIYAFRDGQKDAHADKPPYFWAVFTTPGHRQELLREGWKSVARIIGLGVVMDALYQLIVFKWIYPVELVFIVLLLAFVPYLLLRGPINRLIRRSVSGKVSAR